MEKSVEKKTSAMGTQKLVAIVAMVALFIFFSIFGKGFFKYSTIAVSYTHLNWPLRRSDRGSRLL